MEYIINEENLHPHSKKIKYIINNECWECTSHVKNNNNYIVINRNSKQVLIHRYIYELFKGKIPEGMVIMHKCDNRSCINPEHLNIGTQKDNLHDMHNKERSNVKGRKQTEEHKHKHSISKRKLNENQLLEIKELLLNKVTSKDIALKFNVSSGTIGSIRQGTSIYSDFLNGGYKNWIKKEEI